MDAESDSPRIAAPEVALPKGGGSVQGLTESTEVRAFTGTGVFTVPLYTTPARGLEPQLSLTYESSGGNGVFGLGFGVGVSSIRRRSDKRVPAYDGTDTFLSPDGDELVPKWIPTKDGGWEPDTRTESVTHDGATIVYRVDGFRPRREGSFSIIERWTPLNGGDPGDGDAHWIVLSPDNTTSRYGTAEPCRVADPGDASHVYEWLIAESADDKGNRIVYEYKQENDERVPNVIYETDRSLANKYPSRILYGNLSAQGTTPWAFQIVFDYGEYPVVNPITPTQAWAMRSDPFSTYRPGFEVRTRRLCQRTLLFHSLPEELGEPLTLIREARFHYDATPTRTLLTRVEEIGHRTYDQQGTRLVTSKTLPTIDFQFTPFDPKPDTVVFEPLQFPSGEAVPGAGPASAYQMTDLYGDGLPGILYVGTDAAIYWRPLGNGAYAAPETLPVMPSDLPDEGATLTDLNGDGELELVVPDPTRPGYYRSDFGKPWQAFRPFPAFPLAYGDPLVEQVDLNGSGKSDLLLIEPDATVCYLSRGEQGYDPPVRRERAHDVPMSGTATPTSAVRFANLFGDGLSHRVRIRNGIVECWPNLGHGRFGKPVRFAGAPDFGEAFDASRLFLADIDGSGTTDLIYADTDCLRLYLNRSGNEFAEPITVPLPFGYADPSQIAVADVLGNGTSALVFTATEPEVGLYYADLCGRVKPYLLSQTENRLGVTVRIAYAPSTEYAIQDRLEGREWATVLPFPVQVVSQFDSRDEISGGRVAQRFRYHDGYYDLTERQFCGFGYVEQWDAEEVEASSSRAHRSGATLLNGVYIAPTRYTRTWFHTGAYLESGMIFRQYESEYFKGDPDAVLLPDCVLDPAIPRWDGSQLREATFALSGKPLRQEIYGLDGSASEVNPYSVTENNFAVRRMQPPELARYGSFYAEPRESLEYDYERDPLDPRTTHRFSLRTSPYGSPERRCTLFYPRRANALPEQSQLKAQLAVASYIDLTQSDNLPPNTGETEDHLIVVPATNRLNVLCETREFEVYGLDSGGKAVFTFEMVASQVETALADVLACWTGRARSIGTTRRHPYCRSVRRRRANCSRMRRRPYFRRRCRTVFSRSSRNRNSGIRAGTRSKTDTGGIPV